MDLTRLALDGSIGMMCISRRISQARERPRAQRRACGSEWHRAMSTATHIGLRGHARREIGVSRQYCLDRLTAFWCKRDWTRADIVVLLGIDADRFVDGRGHFSGANLAIGNRLTI